MDEHALFTRFWEDESKTTRRMIARIPEGWDYRPDPKSRTASEIAWQIVCEEKGVIEALETGRFDWDRSFHRSTDRAGTNPSRTVLGISTLMGGLRPAAQPPAAGSDAGRAIRIPRRMKTYTGRPATRSRNP
jgi:hypothetical protein